MAGVGGKHHRPNVPVRTICSLIFGDTLNASQLDLELPAQPLKFRICRIAEFKARRWHRARVVLEQRTPTSRLLLYIFVQYLVHGLWGHTIQIVTMFQTEEQARTLISPQITRDPPDPRGTPIHKPFWLQVRGYVAFQVLSSALSR